MLEFISPQVIAPGREGNEADSFLGLMRSAILFCWSRGLGVFLRVTCIHRIVRQHV